MNGFVMMVTPPLIGADAVPAGLRGLAQKLAADAMPRVSGSMPAGNALHGVCGLAKCHCESSRFQTDGSYSKNTDDMEQSVHDTSRGHR